MRPIIIISFLFLVSCSHEASTEKSEAGTRNVDSVEAEVDSLDYFIKKWTWAEELEDPDSSSIENFPFDDKHLFQTWTSSNFEPTDSILTFHKDFVTIHTDNRKYRYTIDYDSLRIFTSYEIVGAKRTKGIIQELNEDTMLIFWSDFTDVHVWTPTRTE